MLHTEQLPKISKNLTIVRENKNFKYFVVENKPNNR